MMCHDLSAELAQFDLQKEKEFKQMLLDYAAAQLEKHEKVSNASIVASFPSFSVLGSASIVASFPSFSGSLVS